MRRGNPAGSRSPSARSAAWRASQARTTRTAVADDERTGTAGTPNTCRSAVLCARHAFAPTGMRASGVVPEGSQHSCAAAGRSSICGSAARSITQAASATLAWAKPSTASSAKARRRSERRVIAQASYTAIMTWNHAADLMSIKSAPPIHSLVRRSRNAFVTTETELMAMAAPAKIGESRRPNAGYSTPAATGMPSAL